MSEQTLRDDLVERLRRREPSFTGGSLRNPDGPEAADRIERLERALGKIEDMRPVTCEMTLAHMMADIATAALKGQEG